MAWVLPEAELEAKIWYKRQNTSERVVGRQQAREGEKVDLCNHTSQHWLGATAPRQAFSSASSSGSSGSPGGDGSRVRGSSSERSEKLGEGHTEQGKGVPEARAGHQQRAPWWSPPASKGVYPAKSNTSLNPSVAQMASWLALPIAM